MTVEKIRAEIIKNGYTHDLIEEKTGVPKEIIAGILNGEKVNIDYIMMQDLETFFSEELCLRERLDYNGDRQGEYTVEDYHNLPDDLRVELIDGYYFYMEAPSTLHQRIAGEIHRQVANFIYDNDGPCIPFVAPVDVQLDCDNRTMVQPDIAIVCKRDIVKKQVVYGAPDFVLEVISKSTRKKDYTKKLAKYMGAGVKEYWILDPYKKCVLVYDFENEECPTIYGLDQAIPVRLYNGDLVIELKRICEWVEEED